MADTLTQKPAKRKLTSYVLENARERLAAFQAQNVEILTEWHRLRAEVSNAAKALDALESLLHSMCKELEPLLKDE